MAGNGCVLVICSMIKLFGNVESVEYWKKSMSVLIWIMCFAKGNQNCECLITIWVISLLFLFFIFYFNFNPNYLITLTNHFILNTTTNAPSIKSMHSPVGSSLIKTIQFFNLLFLKRANFFKIFNLLLIFFNYYDFPLKRTLPNFVGKKIVFLKVILWSNFFQNSPKYLMAWLYINFVSLYL